MNKKWSEREVRLLRKVYDFSKRRGLRQIFFTCSLENKFTKAQCFDKAKQLGITRKKSHGFGLKWQGKLTEFEKYYLAGILDGEGYICNNYSNYLVGVAMTDKKLIKWLYTKLGGKFYLRKRRKGKNGLCKQEYAWKINGMKQVRSFLAVMSPYLRVKRVKAQKIIKEIDQKPV